MRFVARLAASVAIVLIEIMLTVRNSDGPFRYPRVTTLPVVVAQWDMAEGTVVDRMAVKIVRLPVEVIAPGAFTSIEQLAGRVTRVPVFKGEMMVPGRLAPLGAGPGLEVKITPGKRAMSFRINDASGIAGLVKPNSRVDVLVVINAGEKGSHAKLVMQNMRILAIGQVPQRLEDGRAVSASVATVEVTPDEGEALARVTALGAIQLILRGDENSGRPLTLGSTVQVFPLNGAATNSPATMPRSPTLQRQELKVVRGTIIHRQ